MAATASSRPMVLRPTPVLHQINSQESGLYHHQRSKGAGHKQRLRAASLEPQTLVSAALLSPGFSKSTMDDPEKREGLQISQNVRQQQEELIKRRSSAFNKTAARRTAASDRRAPQRLKLTEAALSRVDRMYAQTAPLHGSFPRDAVPAVVRSQSDELPPIRKIGPITPDSGTLPPLKQHLTLPCPPGMRTAPLTPPTPGTARFDKQTPLSTARLQARKERYLTHCAAAFDALYAS